MRWQTATVDPQQRAELSRSLGVSSTLATLLLRLEIDQWEEAEAFLQPRLKQLRNPFRLHNLERAVERLLRAMRQRESILIYGDYDVDGITSITLLLSVLNAFETYPRFFVPLRLEEGYGLSRDGLERALEAEKPDLLISVDCGTNSSAEVAWLVEQGVDVIIVDHHTCKQEAPADAIVVNPHLHEAEDTPWHDMCAVGLVFKLVHGLLKVLREEGEERAYKLPLKETVDLVALGTLADMVPLRGENRILAKVGLEMLRKTQRPGLNALYEVSGMQLGAAVSPFDVAFRIGPRLNACGRLADARAPIDLLMSRDWKSCRLQAEHLEAHNRERQDIERAMLERVKAQAEAQLPEAPALVTFDSEGHAGVAGIVASRLVQLYHRPAIVLAEEGALAKGSGRSIAGVNLIEALQVCASLMQHWGGHPMAAGITIPKENFEGLKEQFQSAVEGQLKNGLPERVLELACWVQQEELTAEFFDELDTLGPFGQGNPEPVFGLEGVQLKDTPKVFGQGHFRFQLNGAKGAELRGIAWKLADRLPPSRTPLNLAVRLGWNHWNGRRYPQLTLVDWQEG